MFPHLKILCLIQILTRLYGFELGAEHSNGREERALLFPKASTLGVSFLSARHPV